MEDIKKLEYKVTLSGEYPTRKELVDTINKLIECVVKLKKD